MSSIPLPRVLQAKKTSVETDKEQLDKQMVSDRHTNLKTSLSVCVFFFGFSCRHSGRFIRLNSHLDFFIFEIKFWLWLDLEERDSCLDCSDVL